MSDFNLSTSSSNSSAATVTDPSETEDCLFLDVMVPEAIFNSNEQHPVLVWIYGGGYTAGSKSGSGDPAGLLKRSQMDNSSGVIYVALNYRLGAMGWLSGPTFQKNGTANAGLWDQRFALEWVQQNIHLFGGNPNNVTVFGESAGGGSIMHQITAFGGLKGPAPFAGAVPQSPGFFPVTSPSTEEGIFNDFLALLNVSTLAEARQLPSSAIIAANAKQVYSAAYGQFVYGPSVDGDFVPALPGQLLAHGQYDKNVTVMTGHNANEGLLFTSPFINNNSALDTY
ncbi:carboxylesterase family protein-like protein, partial [Aureobasidium melanogenum]